jgi:acyl-CoA synthetase (AMP-forming)/AMP-acid ligase II
MTVTQPTTNAKLRTLGGKIVNTADYLLRYGLDQDIVLITKHGQYTYTDLRLAAARLVGELLAAGVRPGDRVGILGENSIFWVAAYLATLKLAAVAVPFPTVSTPDELKSKAGFINCKVLFADRHSHRKFKASFNENTQLILNDSLDREGKSLWPESPSPFDLEADAAYMLTSGTTALPRAVRITHRNIQSNTTSIIQYLDLDCSDRILVVLPFYYCFGTSLLHTHLRVGGSLTLCNTFAYPETALDMLESTSCTGFAGVPSTYQLLLRNTSFPARKFKSLRKVQQAGGKLPVVFIQELKTALSQAQLFIMYGQTEATARLSFLHPEMLGAKIGSIGRGIPGVILRVLDEAGSEVKPGEVGEIYAWGENISPGYLGSPADNLNKFVDGGLRTGDLATIDKDGYIYIVDRKADFIKVLGHRVSSQEVEANILELPDVIAAAAIGVPDDLLGEAIRVFVIIRNSSRLTPENILEHCHMHLARHMVPKEIVQIEKLPMNAHGKPIKSVLRELKFA